MGQCISFCEPVDIDTCSEPDKVTDGNITPVPSTDSHKSPHHHSDNVTPSSSTKPSYKSPKNSNRVRTISDVQPATFKLLYLKGTKLGTGAFGTVYAAVNRRTNLKCAYKEILKSRMHPSKHGDIMREVSILNGLGEHPHIVKLLDFFEDSSKFYLVMELLVGGELFDRIVKKSVYTEKEARDLVVSLLRALKHCHDRGVVHRDLKPENLILASEDDDSDVKLIDFGMAKIANGFSLKTMCGSPGYMAPEVITGCWYGSPADAWSVGVLIYILLGGYPPFNEKTEADTLLQSSKGAYRFHSEYWSDISPEAKELIRGLLTLDMNKRMTIDQALNHKWVSH